MGDTLVISEFYDEWSVFSSPKRTPKLNPTGQGTMASFESVKGPFFEEVLHIYPYYTEDGEFPDTLRPYLYDMSSDGIEFILEYYPAGEKSPYENLKKVMFEDFSQVWLFRVGMETVEEYPNSTGMNVLFLVGQTACGHWVGLKTFTVNT